MRGALVPVLVVVTMAAPSTAAACGCFVQPDPITPVVQAGERILFASDGGEVTAHIQILYQGSASQFGWLLPLPSVPTLELGTDELFAQLERRTTPTYRINRVFPRPRASLNLGCAASTSAGGAPRREEEPDDSPLVVADSIGPYDYAVLEADDRQAVLRWLDENRYFVPTGTDDALGPYVRPGAYILALKLSSGRSTGEIQPVVVRYASDLPMIPIILTAVAAVPNMGILVWVLGDARAIPRNYHHTVINDALLDYLGGAANYNAVITRAVGEAPGKHAFVTQYAGRSSFFGGVLDPPGRFGTEAGLARVTDAALLSGYLADRGFLFVGPLIGVLQRHIPIPETIARTDGAIKYYSQLHFYLGAYRQAHPEEFAGLDFRYDAAALARDVFAAVVEPTLAAALLFYGHPYLTRLYTTLSPEDMTLDPVFGFNPDLPEVPLEHVVTQTNEDLTTEQGWVLDVGDDGRLVVPPGMPAAARTEILRESGPPEVVTDNGGAIAGALGGPGACSVATDSSPPRSRDDGAHVALAVLAALFGGAALRLRRRRGRR